MTRSTLRSTLFALAALALPGCGGENPLGPSEPAGRPSLANVGPGDRNGNGVLCGRRINDDAVGGVVGTAAGGDAGGYAAPGYVFVDDRNGVCPGGFSRVSPP